MIWTGERGCRMCFWIESASSGGSSAVRRCVASVGGSTEGISAIICDGNLVGVRFGFEFVDAGGGNVVSWLFCASVQGRCEGKVAV